MSVSTLATRPALDTTAATRTWFVNADGIARTLVLPSAPGAGDGWVSTADNGADVLDSLSGPDANGNLSFREVGAEGYAWYRARVVEGVLVGRLTSIDDAVTSPPWNQYTAHLTGWNRGYFERATTPRVFDVTLDNDLHATLRIDRDGARADRFVGSIKTYANEADGARDEQEQRDIVVSAWDGTRLAFELADGTATFSGRVEGRDVAGAYVRAGSAAAKMWVGTRSEVLAYGASTRTDEGRRAWQTATRAQLAALMMAGAPAPTTASVRILSSEVAPFGTTTYLPNRDDDPVAHPAAYRLAEIEIAESFANPYGGTTINRTVHGWLATPDSQPPPGGFPAVVVVNGHKGSAHNLFDPNDSRYWYGDGFARRGAVVLAIDISHRPYEDRAALYDDFLAGDDGENGNGPHPAIKPAGFDSDWEEDGERVSDAMRGRELLTRMPGVDASNVIIAGLSMGGEISTFAAALDPSFMTVVAAGFSPDLRVVERHGNHSCWRWQHAEITDYVSTSDLHALIAPRTLVVETGKIDETFSYFAVPFAADKQVAQRSRVAYAADARRFVHYLHYDAHRFHIGDLDPRYVVERNVRVPVETSDQGGAFPAWQIDPSTVVFADTLFSYLGLTARD